MKKIKNNTFKIKKNIILLLSIISLCYLTSCSSDDTNNVIDQELPTIKDNPKQDGYPIIIKQVPYASLKMPAEPQKLVYDVNKKDVPLSTIKDTVIINIDGGPVHTIGEEVSMIKSIISPEFPNYSVIGLRQAHVINPTVFGSGRSFTAANAQETNEKTVNILKTVIIWLKSNHKVVYIFGHSNGSFVIQNYMSKNLANPDGYIISGTRIKTAQAFFDNYPKNLDVFFTNGVTVATKNIPDNELPYFNVLSKLQLNHMKNYINLLSKNPMLHKTVYLLAGKDAALGTIDENEKAFLSDNKIENIFLTEGTHNHPPYFISDALLYLRKAKTTNKAKHFVN